MLKNPDFIVFTPQFDANNGGAIALHKLCHLINNLGLNCYLMPFFDCHEISPFDDLLERIQALNAIKKNIINASFNTNPIFNTPIYPFPIEDIKERNDLVIIYPEIIFGNPLRGKHIARWLLHEPGYHRKNVYCVPGEVHFRYLEMHRAVHMPWLEIADQLLTVSHVPWEYYQPSAADHPRHGTAYAVRKGRNKRIAHDLSKSIQIDGLSHKEIGAIFSRIKTFISYDTRTMYSALAALAGADSVVVPDDGIDEETWQPDPQLRAGIAYGFERLQWAQATRHLVCDLLRKQEHSSRDSVQAFIDFWVKRLNLVE